LLIVLSPLLLALLPLHKTSSTHCDSCVANSTFAIATTTAATTKHTQAKEVALHQRTQTMPLLVMQGMTTAIALGECCMSRHRVYCSATCHCSILLLQRCVSSSMLTLLVPVCKCMTVHIYYSDLLLTRAIYVYTIYIACKYTQH
jgi:hypothetical protein